MGPNVGKQMWVSYFTIFEKMNSIYQENTLSHLCANLWLKIQNINGCKSELNKFNI